MKIKMRPVLKIFLRSLEAKKASPNMKQAKKIPSKRIVDNVRATIIVKEGFLLKSKTLNL